MWSKSLGFSSVANSSELSASMSYYISGRASMDGPLNNVLSSPVSLSDSLLLHLMVLSYFYFLAPSLQFNRKWSWSVFLKEAFTLSSFFALLDQRYFHLHWISSPQIQIFKWQQSQFYHSCITFQWSQCIKLQYKIIQFESKSRLEQIINKLAVHQQLIHSVHELILSVCLESL